MSANRKVGGIRTVACDIVGCATMYIVDFDTDAETLRYFARSIGGWRRTPRPHRGGRPRDLCPAHREER